MKLPLNNLLNKSSEETQVEQERNDSVSPAQQLGQGMNKIQDVIAPSSIEADFNHIRMGQTYFRTLFITGYPRFVGANWLAPVINFEHTLTLSMFYYPVSSNKVLNELKRKLAEMEATVRTDLARGKLVDPAVQAALEDAQELQDQLVKGVERFFQFGFYITISANSEKELDAVTSRLESTLGSLMLISKQCTLQMEDGFQTTTPTGLDKLNIVRNMDTTSLASTFPFTSSELTANEGILYGINEHNGSLIVFDRFTLENANAVVFGKSGSGKSFAIKLEVLRSLLFGTEVIVIDPENEYYPLAEAVGGDVIDFTIHGETSINPFDLSGVAGEDEDELSLKILSLHALFGIIFEDLSNTESAILDRALIATYRMKGITRDPETHDNEPPIMEDLYKVLLGMPETEARGLAERLERFVKGSLAGIFDKPSNVNIKNTFTVFSVRNLEDALRPIAMFIILDFIWNKVKKETKKRILLVDEAWYLIAHPDSAMFLYSIAKRGRKYYLGLTTITQDVDDFLKSDYGRAIVTNSSIQLLMKQHPAAIEQVADVFNLSEGEKSLLLSADIGEGLFFAGNSHVAMQVVASEEEYQLVTTKPAEVIEREKRTESGKSEKTEDHEEEEEEEKKAVNESTEHKSPRAGFQFNKETGKWEETEKQ